MGNGKRPGALVDAVDRILREDLAGRILPFDSDAAQSCATIADLCDPGKMHEGLRAARRHSDEVLESVYIGRRFRNDIERLEKRFEMYPWMTTKDSA